jgi:RHS repeat-associated protein
VSLRTFPLVGPNIAPNPGFESAGSWSTPIDGTFPGTSFYRGSWAIAAPRSGSYAYAISNLAYGRVEQSIAVAANTLYDLSAWVRGELDPEGSDQRWLAQVEYYNSSGQLISSQDVLFDYQGSLNTTWQFHAGRFTTPANTATVKLRLHNILNSGWVAFDDVRLSREITRSTYGLAGQAVAIRVSGDPVTERNGLFFFHSDHLGSTTKLSDRFGVLEPDSTARYYPFGDYRTEPTAGITDRGFTGHEQENLAANDLGLIYMQARYYVAALGRFASADTVVPEPGNPQSFNRFSYVRNSPVKLVDPSGHDPLDAQWESDFRAAHGRDPDWYDRLIRLFSIAFPDEWDWGAFYNSDGTLRGFEQLEDMMRNTPASRNWANLPDALVNLAGWYNSNETEAFVRDIGSLFGGLPNRFEATTNQAVTGCAEGLTCEDPATLPAHVWAHLQATGMPTILTGYSDADANVHHWAWALVLGYQEGNLALVINSYREFQQAGGPFAAANDIDARADIWLGNRAALMGMDLAAFGVSPNTIRFFWQLNVAEW